MAQQVEHVLGKEYRDEKRASRKPLKFGKNFICCYGSVGRARPW